MRLAVRALRHRGYCRSYFCLAARNEHTWRTTLSAAAAVSRRQLVESRHLDRAGRFGFSSFIAFINNGSTAGCTPTSAAMRDRSADLWLSVHRRRQRGSATRGAVPVRRESDGVNHATRTSFPFYPIPDEAITQAHWIEGGEPGNVDLRSSRTGTCSSSTSDQRYLFELYNVFYDGTQWHAGSGAFFDLKSNNRRPDGWTSADAAGLAILPGLVRYDEVFGAGESATRSA